MPVTIKSSQVKVKGTDGYVGIDALADSTTASRVAAITSAGTAVLEDIQELRTTTEEAVAQAAAAARASIPGEYTQLSDDVTELKSAAGGLYDIAWEVGQITSTGEMGTSNAYRRTADFIPTNSGVKVIFDTAVSVYVAEYSGQNNDYFQLRHDAETISELDVANYENPYVKFFVNKENIDFAHMYIPGAINTRMDAIEARIDEFGSIEKAGIDKCNWVALGDSITQGWYSYYDGITPASKSPTSGGDTFDKMWVKIAANLLGFTVDNRGVGGSGWVDKGSVASPKPSARQLIDGSVSGYPAPDFTECNLVTLAWGLNDWKGSVDFGSFDDDISTADTVIANMRYVIEHIVSANPNCKIIGLSPLNCMYGQSQESTNWARGLEVNGKTLDEAWAIMKSVYDYYDIETIDLLTSSYLNRKNITSLLIDGIHPSKQGHEMMGRDLAAKIHYR